MASHRPIATRRLGSPSLLLSTPERGCFCGHPCSEASQTLGRPTSAHSTQEVLSGQKERVFTSGLSVPGSPSSRGNLQ